MSALPCLWYTECREKGIVNSCE